MSILDLVLIAILVVFVFSGLRKGLIRSLGHIVSIIFGAYIASHYYLNFYQWGAHWVNNQQTLGKVLAFIILFITATQLIRFGFYLIEKAFNLLAIIPGSKYINNLLGGILGLLEGALFLGLIIYVASRYAAIDGSFGDKLASSLVAPWLMKTTDLILPVLPEALKALQSLI